MFPESHAFAFGVTTYQMSWLKYYYPLEFYVGIFNQQPMGFYNPETLKEDAKRHGIRVLNPDINRSNEECVIDDEAVRLGFRYVAGLGPAASDAIINARDSDGNFSSVTDFMERTGLQHEALDNLADAGAFDSLTEDRRSTRWEIGLSYRPVNEQLALPLPIAQDMAELPELTEWEVMEGEYRTMGIHPGSHVMAHLSKHLGPDVLTSRDVSGLEDGTEVTVAGLVVRRQRPLGKAVFITLEDANGHTPLILWPKVYAKYKLVLREPLVQVRGMITRRDGTMNILVTHASRLPGMETAPRAKNWG